MLRNKKGSQIAATAVDIEESRTSDVPKDVEVKEQTNAEKATAQLCENINENSDDLNILQPTCETSEKAQNSSIETPNATDSPSLAVCFDGDATDKKDNPSIKTTQQRQTILTGFVGTALLVSSVALIALFKIIRTDYNNTMLVSFNTIAIKMFSSLFGLL